MNRGDFIISSGASSNLNNYYEQYEIYQLVTSGTTGTIEIPKIGGGSIEPSKYTVQIDGYSGGIDALILETSGGKPVDKVAKDVDGINLFVILTGTDNRTYLIHNTCATYPTALVYKVRLSIEAAKELDPNYVVGREVDVSLFETVSNKKTDLTDNSDTYYPSQKAVKTAVDGKVSKITSVDKRIVTFNGTTGDIQDDSLLKLSQGVFSPTSDSTTAIQITKADGTTVIFNIDSINGNFGIGGSIVPTVNNSCSLGSVSKYMKLSYIFGLDLGGSSLQNFNQIFSGSYDLSVVAGNGKSTIFKSYVGATLNEWARFTGSGDFNHLAGKYFYQAASPTADTVYDHRMYTSGEVLFFQYCGVANVNKGSGGWTTTLVTTPTYTRVYGALLVSGTNIQANQIRTYTSNSALTVTAGDANQLVLLNPTNGGNVAIGQSTADEKLVVNGFIKALSGYKSADGSDGASGSFTSADGKTITVKNGLITSII